MSKTRKFSKVVHMWIGIKDLTVHPKIQRRFNPSWAKNILADFDPDALGELDVVKEGDRYLVFDGQHRLWAAREYLGEEQMVQCAVHQNIDIARQAELFLKINNQRSLRAVDRFVNAVRAGRETEVRAASLLAEHKLIVDEVEKEGAVRAVVAVCTVLTRYGEQTLRRSLTVLRQAWGRDPGAYTSHLISGLGLLIHRFNGEIDDKELSGKIQKAGVPGGFIGKARSRAATVHTSTGRAMAEELLSVWNKGRRKNHLSF